MIALIFCLHSVAHAVPMQMTHQGRLIDTNGAAISGVQSLTFTIFDDPNNGSDLWTETLTVAFNNGYFATVLGSDEITNPLDSLILGQYPLYLEVQVGQGTPLSPRTTLQSVPYSQISGTAESVDGGTVVASEVSIGTQPVINNQGEWVGPSISVNWNDIDPTSIPADLTDGDNDTQLSESQVEGYIENDVISLMSGSTIQGEGLILSEGSLISWGQLDINTIPSDLSDGDDDTLASLSCSLGEIPSWSGGAWVCTSDNTLDASELGVLLSNNAVDLNPSTTIGGLDIVTTLDDSDTLANLSCINDGDIPRYDLVSGGWYCDAESGLSTTQVISTVENASSLTLPSSTTLNGSTILTNGSTLSWNQLDSSSIPAGLSDGDDVLSESDVETMVTNGALDLANNTTVDGEMIVTTPPSCLDGQILSYDAASGFWNCIDFSNIIDQDGDGILAWNDCDDGDATLLAIANDADCDGIESTQDCDDNNPNSTAIADDADCDGYLTVNDCDDSRADILDSGTGATSDCAASTCQEIRSDYTSSNSGLYWISPDGGTAYQAYCDMTTDGGGWTLLGTVFGGDSNNWNTEFGYWSNTSTLGNASNPFDDFKSEAWIDYDLNGSEAMIERRYNGSIQSQTRLSNSCLHNKTYFYQLFTTWDTSLRCGRSEITVITPASSTTGLSSSLYREGVNYYGMDGSDTNGWCWNGGDNNSNIFKGHAGYNQSAYGCYGTGHLSYVGVFTNSSSQYSNSDITGTNWINGTNYTLTGLSFYVR